MKIKESDIDNVCNILKKGGLISFATDTVYSIACDAQNETAIDKLYRVKNRDRTKFLGILVASVADVELICAMRDYEKEFLKKFYDKGLTMILPKKKVFPKYIGNSNTIAIRVANTDFSQKLASKFSGFIAMTSLNIGNQKEITTFRDADANFSDKLDIIIDGGTCKFGCPSTIVRFDNEEVDILRQGCFIL